MPSFTTTQNSAFQWPMHCFQHSTSVLIPALDIHVLDTFEGCEGRRKVAVRTKRALRTLELQSIQMGCTWKVVGEGFGDSGAEPSIAHGQRLEMPPSPSPVGAHEEDEGENLTVIAELDGPLEKNSGTVTIETSAGMHE